MMGYRGLIQWKAGGEIADTYFFAAGRQRRENREPMRIRERLEERGRRCEVFIDHPGGRTAPLYRHNSILRVESNIVNIRALLFRAAKCS